jgi:hypothetical protein
MWSSTLPAEHKSLLGLDFNLIDPKDARTKIVKSCVKCWYQSNDRGLLNMSDCSGFVISVQRDLYLRPFDGPQANDIYDEVDCRGDWIVLGLSSHGAQRAGVAANDGRLTVAIWKNEALDEHHRRKHGHIAIITSYLSLVGVKPEQHAIGAWGQLGHVGRLLDRMSQSFGKDKHPSIKYAYCQTPIVVLA